MLRDSASERPATLRLSPPADGSPSRTPLGAGWRHDLDIVLTRDGRDLVVRDGRQTRHVFVPSRSGVRSGARRYRSLTSGGGALAMHGKAYVWTRADATRVVFAGSLPIRIESIDGDSSTLHYDDGRLVAVTRKGPGGGGGTMRFGYANGRLDDIVFPDGTAHALIPGPGGSLSTRRRAPPVECRHDDDLDPLVRADDEGHEPAGDGADDAAPESSPITRCDTTADPPDVSFGRVGIPGAVRVDARPASCESYFVEYQGTERGTAIESGLTASPHYAGYAPTVRSFPMIDFAGPELRVVRSRDLALPSYDSDPDGLLERLLRDGAEIESGLLEPLARDGRVSVTELGRTTTIAYRPSRPVVLELVVRHGIASLDQRAQIRRAAAELVSRHGILLRVVEIP